MLCRRFSIRDDDADQDLIVGCVAAFSIRDDDADQDQSMHVVNAGMKCTKSMMTKMIMAA